LADLKQRLADRERRLADLKQQSAAQEQQIADLQRQEEMMHRMEGVLEMSLKGNK